MSGEIARALFPPSMFLYGLFAVRPAIDAGVNIPVVVALIAMPIVAFIAASIGRS